MERRWMSTSLDPAELDHQYAAAISAGAAAGASQPRAVTACYEACTRTLIVRLRDGTSVVFPVSSHPALKQLEDEQVETVHVSRSGYGLHWDDVDVHIAGPQLVAWLKKQ